MNLLDMIRDKDAPRGPNDGTTTIRLSPSTALAFILALSTALLSYGNLQTRIAQIELWKDGTQANRFTNTDFEKERALITSDIDRMSQEVLILCQQMVYLSKQVKGGSSLSCPLSIRSQPRR